MNGDRATAPRFVTPAEIIEQREKGWPDFHPEDYCHRCGGPNCVWFTDSDSWRRATASDPRGVLAILCPPCFSAAWEEASGLPACWEVRPSVQTLHRLVGAEPGQYGEDRNATAGGS